MKTSFLILLTLFLFFNYQGYSQTGNDYGDRASEKYLNEDYKGAILDYTKAIWFDGNNMHYLMMRGLAKEEINDNYGAISDFDKIIDHKSNAKNFIDSLSEKDNLQGAYYNIGKVKNRLKDYKGAISSLNKAIELYRDDYHSYSERGDAKFSLLDYRGAITDYDKCIEYSSSNIYYNRSAYCNKGLAKINLGRKEEGCLDLSKAGELGYDYAYEAIKKYCQ